MHYRLTILQTLALLAAALWGAGGHPPAPRADLFPEVSVAHEAGAYFHPRHPVAITALIQGDQSVQRVRCYFRYQPSAPYLFLPMESTPEGGRRCTLPAPGAAAEELEYVFLIVNESLQVIVTTPFKAVRDAARPLPAWQQEGRPAPARAYSETETHPAAPQTYALEGRVAVEKVATSLRYALKVGLYPPGDLDNYIYNYFGGFLLDPASGRLSPVKGYAYFPRQSRQGGPGSGAAPGVALEDVLGVLNRLADLAVPDAQAAVTYPDINGDNWTGRFYITGTSYTQNITAEAQHNGSGGMWLRTSRPTNSIGHYFSGSLSANGDMYLYDAYDNEIWTTHFGPATATRILIADYTDKTFTEYYIIDLTRGAPTVPGASDNTTAAMLTIIQQLLLDDP